MTQSMKYERTDEGLVHVKLFNVVEDGENELADEAIYDTADLPEVNQLRARAYGISKIMAERTSELSPSPDKLEGIQEVWDALLTGEWERERKKGGGPTVRIEIEALAAMRGITVKQAQTLLKRYDKEKQEEIFAHEAVQAKVAELQEQMEDTADATFDDLIS